MNSPTSFLVALAGLYCTATTVTAAVIYSESSEPDLPDNYLSSLVIPLGAGSNILSARVRESDPDFFTLRVGQGLRLETISVLFYQHVISGNSTFIGFQNAPVLDEDPTGISEGEIFHTLFSSGDENSDILARVQRPPGAELTDFGTGDYAFWINEIEPEIAVFTLDFTVVAVPEPTTPTFFFLAGCLTMGRRTRQ